jgi:precorrin-6Y C5,15-methyltransferase (decarboxylating)
MAQRPLPDPPVHVIGLGPQPGAALGPGACAALGRADVLIGSRRHLAAFPDLEGSKFTYPSPLSALEDLLRTHRHRRIAVLASGDPLCFGIGEYLIRHLGPGRLVFHPNVSSLQAAFARIKKPWQHAHLISLHGRPLESLRGALRANRLYALFTDANNNPVTIAGVLRDTGFGDSTVWVAEDLGADTERVREYRADALADTATDAFSPLNVVIAETRGPGGVLPEFPGIPDEQFAVDGTEPGKGMLSKREVRLTILSLLAPRGGDIGWDVGAGCGGVSVEWARWNPFGSVYAMEYHEQRLQCLETNRRHFGVTGNLHIVAGHAPAICAPLPDPDAAFVGGSGGELGSLLAAIWGRLKPGGRLVVSAVTEDSRADLHGFAQGKPASWTELSIARGDSLAGQRVLRPFLPVLLAKLEKTRS